MFDIGFSEIVVCAVVALIVIGPERMPEAVRTMGLWIGRFKRSMRETRQEIERQIGVEDIRRQLHNEDIMRSLEKTRDDINKELNSVIEHVQADLDAEERSKPRVYEHESELPNHSHEHPQEAPADKDNTPIAAPHAANANSTTHAPTDSHTKPL